MSPLHDKYIIVYVDNLGGGFVNHLADPEI
jgi:hypothetical protein